ALLGWQQRRDEVSQMVELWSSSLASLWPASLMNRSRVSIVETQTTSAPQAEAPSAAGSESGVARTAQPNRPTSTASDLRQQLQSITHDLSILRQNLEQLAAKQAQWAAKQEQLAQDIASLRVVKSDDKLTTSSTAPPRHGTLAPRNKPSLLPPPPAD